MVRTRNSASRLRGHVIGLHCIAESGKLAPFDATMIDYVLRPPQNSAAKAIIAYGEQMIPVMESARAIASHTGCRNVNHFRPDAFRSRRNQRHSNS